MEVENKTIVVTGAGSGIGRELALECRRRGASLALADIDREGLRQTSAMLDGPASGNAKCSVHPLDVSSLDAWRTFRETVLEEHGAVDGVINNAGMTVSASVADLPYEQLERIMSVNFMGMVYGSKEFLPHLTTRPEGLIANVSSVFGLFPLQNQSAYCASKFAIRGFTEVLAQELKGSAIFVASIHPGHIGTDIIGRAIREGGVVGTDLSDAAQAEYAKAFKVHGLSAGTAARIILDGLRRKQRKILVGRDAVRGDLFSRIAPQRFADTVNKPPEPQRAG